MPEASPFVALLAKIRFRFQFEFGLPRFRVRVYRVPELCRLRFYSAWSLGLCVALAWPQVRKIGLRGLRSSTVGSSAQVRFQNVGLYG